MVDAGIAEIMRVSVNDAECLLNGHICANVADALGVEAAQLQSFIDAGTATGSVAARLGTQMASAEDVGNRLTRKGRIGLVVGMLLR